MPSQPAPGSMACCVTSSRSGRRCTEWRRRSGPPWRSRHPRVLAVRRLRDLRARGLTCCQAATSSFSRPRSSTSSSAPIPPSPSGSRLDRRRRGPTPWRQERPGDPPRAPAHDASDVAAPDARRLFLSAVVPNVDQVARWLDPGGRRPSTSVAPTGCSPGSSVVAGEPRRIDTPARATSSSRTSSAPRAALAGLSARAPASHTAALARHTVAQSAAALALHFQRIGPRRGHSPPQPRNCAAVCKALVDGLVAPCRGRRSARTSFALGRSGEIDELVALAAKHLGAEQSSSAGCDSVSPTTTPAFPRPSGCGSRMRSGVARFRFSRARPRFRRVSTCR